MKIHKSKIIKTKPGHNPIKPECDSQDAIAQMAREWENVTCKKCLARKPK